MASFSILTSNISFGNEAVPTHAFLTTGNGTMTLKRNDGVPERFDVQGNVVASYILGNGSQLTGLTVSNASMLTEGTLKANIFPQTIGNATTVYVGNGYALSNINGANITGPIIATGAVDGSIDCATDLTGTIPQALFPTTIGNASTRFIGNGALLTDTSPLITGAASTIVQANLSTSRAVVSDVNGKVSVGNTTATEIEYLRGLTGNVQSQFNTLQAVVPSNLTTSRVLVSNATGTLAPSNVTSTELDSLKGVTGNVQSQLDLKQAKNVGTASRALVTDAAGNITVSATTSASLGYLEGVTSSVQSQLDTKFPRNVNAWLTSTEGTNRFKFSSGDKTYYGTGNGHEWQNASNLAVMTLNETGNVTATRFHGNVDGAYLDGNIDGELLVLSGTFDSDVVLTPGCVDASIHLANIGNFIPAIANTYTLGNVARPWKDLYLGNSAMVNNNPVMAMSTSASAGCSAFIHPLACEVYSASSPGVETGVISIVHTGYTGADVCGMYGYPQNIYHFWRTYVNLVAGTYKCRIYIGKSTDRGMATLVVNGISVGTADSYAPTLNNTEEIVTTPTFSVSYTGIHKFEVQINSKNASSSNYYFIWKGASFIRTA